MRGGTLYDGVTDISGGAIRNLGTTHYFFVNNGDAAMENLTSQREMFVSSVIGAGNVIAVLVGLLFMIMVVEILISNKTRKNVKPVKKKVSRSD